MRLRTMFLIVLSLMMAFALVGCDDPTPTAGDSVTEGEATETTDQAEAPSPLNLEVGQPANYGKYVVTLNKVEAGPKDYSGKETLLLEVTYENKDTESMSYNEYDWKLEDANGGRTQDAAFVDEGPDTLGSGDVAPGGKVSGVVLFNVKGETTKVIFEPSFWSSEEKLASWVVK